MMKREELQNHLTIHYIHTVADFFKANPPETIASDREAWTKFVSFQVDELSRPEYARENFERGGRAAEYEKANPRAKLPAHLLPIDWSDFLREARSSPLRIEKLKVFYAIASALLDDDAEEEKLGDAELLAKLRALVRELDLAELRVRRDETTR